MHRLLENVSEIISKKKWCALFAYRPPKQNKTLIFEEIPSS